MRISFDIQHILELCMRTSFDILHILGLFMGDLGTLTAVPIWWSAWWSNILRYLNLQMGTFVVEIKVEIKMIKYECTRYIRNSMFVKYCAHKNTHIPRETSFFFKSYNLDEVVTFHIKITFLTSGIQSLLSLILTELYFNVDRQQFDLWEAGVKQLQLSMQSNWSAEWIETHQRGKNIYRNGVLDHHLHARHSLLMPPICCLKFGFSNTPLCDWMVGNLEQP